MLVVPATRNKSANQTGKVPNLRKETMSRTSKHVRTFHIASIKTRRINSIR